MTSLHAQLACLPGLNVDLRDLHSEDAPCRAKPEHVSAFEGLVGTQIHMSRMNMPPSFLSGMTSPVLRLTMRDVFIVRITS